MAFLHQLLREYEIAAQLEATYGVSPGALAGANFFKHRSDLITSRKIERYMRDQDRDNGQASVLTVQTGRESASLSIEADLIPAGQATPTPPDIDVFIVCNMGTKHAATAHTTTAAGSTGVTLNLAVGGGAASGLQANDFLAVDIDGNGTYEARQAISIATDVVTIDRAFTSNPAAGRDVKVGVTYKLLQTALGSAYIWRFNNNNLRYVIPGSIVPEMDLSMNFADTTPVGKAKFSLDGQRQRPQTATTRPTPSTKGVPLVPSKGTLWLGAGVSPTKLVIVDCGLNVKSGIELRNNQSSQLFSDGPKRTGNSGRYDVEQTITLLADDISQVVYDNAVSLTAQDALIQLGIVPGSIVAWRTPNWRPDADESDLAGEVGYKLAGRCLGTVNDDEVFLAFL